MFLLIYDDDDRGMPLSRNVDRDWKWRRMEEEETVFVYREGTLDQTTYHLYHLKKPSSGNGDDSVLIRDKGKNAPITCIVPLKDIIVVWFSSSFQFLNDHHALGNWYFFFFFIYLVQD